MKIKNLLFQPLTLHLAGGEKSLHLFSRECREIPSEHISEEIRLAAARGLVSLIKSDVNGTVEEPDSQLVEKQDEPAKPSATDPRKNRKGDRRR